MTKEELKALEMSLLNDLPELIRKVEKLNLSILERESLGLDKVKNELREYYKNVRDYD
ncbi:hypothetical protein IR083_21035 [Dysgonomonas sp. GY75]|uniref:hypothetical protein n=1 Tax=Dysgonomonas sp. GY75 TaxID=2780419 RepID=UPI0018835B9A|nr:hypothetical protein [Dysgonomonas sp. GY75]MBF0651307.1 hypothetical protein [Dysgonomonas sp. GY75]